ncbi:uncharacterized protein LOC128484112 [Spea bombifrons]|uniref:uncharacterized protein LOC128484112 n=1 Tax=Spea bombifrons TaxID=233779 RepID=UPI00234BC365|nr:uncharacterized protein LOC128484112 [Spea bombifrons]
MSDCSISLMSQRDGYSNYSEMVGNPSPSSLQDWIIFPVHLEIEILLIPTTACFVAAFFVTPSILFAIFSNFSIRQETRFLLLANALICDLIFLLLYTATCICNVMSLKIPKLACTFLLFSLAVTYCGGVLTAAGMVVDTYLAILWPLHYFLLLPPSRTKKLIMLLWFSSCFFPAVLFLVLYFTQHPGPCQPDVCSLPLILVMTLHADETIRLFHILFITSFLLSFVLILCFYIVLCFKTRGTGIFKGVSSRATVTFMMHHIILGFYLFPLLLLLAESLLYINNRISFRTGLLLTFIICNVLIVLPKGVSPYLYGFRYREIYKSLKLFCKFKRHSFVAPANSELLQVLILTSNQSLYGYAIFRMLQVQHDYFTAMVKHNDGAKPHVLPPDLYSPDTIGLTTALSYGGGDADLGWSGEEPPVDSRPTGLPGERRLAGAVMEPPVYLASRPGRTLNCCRSGSLRFDRISSGPRTIYWYPVSAAAHSGSPRKRWLKALTVLITPPWSVFLVPVRCALHLLTSSPVIEYLGFDHRLVVPLASVIDFEFLATDSDMSETTSCSTLYLWLLSLVSVIPACEHTYDLPDTSAYLH